MVSPFDPLGSLSRLLKPTTDPGELVDRWFEATTWWVEPAAAVSGAAAARLSPERLLADVVDGIAGRFVDQPVRVTLADRPFAARLESVRVLGDARVLVELADADWDGVAVDQVSIRATGVRLTPGAPARLTAEALDVFVRTGLDQVVAWAAGQGVPWDLSVDDAGLVVAEDRARPLRLRADPSLVDGRVQLEVRAVRWRGREACLPSWLRLTRRLELPPLPDRVELLGAHRNGTEVWVRLRVHEVRTDLDLGRLRDAVRSGSNLLLGR